MNSRNSTGLKEGSGIVRLDHSTVVQSAWRLQTLEADSRQPVIATKVTSLLMQAEFEGGGRRREFMSYGSQNSTEDDSAMPLRVLCSKLQDYNVQKFPCTRQIGLRVFAHTNSFLSQTESCSRLLLSAVVSSRIISIAQIVFPWTTTHNTIVLCNKRVY